MGNAASKAGWLIFILALGGAMLHSGPDDPITAGLKSSGLYQPLMVILSTIIVLTLLWIARIMKKPWRCGVTSMNSKTRKAGEPCLDFAPGGQETCSTPSCSIGHRRTLLPFAIY